MRRRRTRHPAGCRPVRFARADGAAGPDGPARRRAPEAPARQGRRSAASRVGRVEQVAGNDRVVRVGPGIGCSPATPACCRLPRPEEGGAEVELDDGALRMEAGELGEPVDGAGGPLGVGLSHLGLERVVPPEQRGRPAGRSRVVEQKCSAKIDLPRGPCGRRDRARAAEPGALRRRGCARGSGRAIVGQCRDRHHGAAARAATTPTIAVTRVLGDTGGR